MRHANRSPEQVPLILFDLIGAIGCFIAAAYYDLPVTAMVYLLYEGGLTASVFAAATLVILLYSRGVYAKRVGRLDLVQDLSLALGFAFILQAVVYYVHRGFALPPAVLMFGTVLFALLFSVRFLLQRLRSGAKRVERMLFIGATPVNRRIAGLLADHPDFGYSVTGYLDDSLPAGAELEGGRVLGRLSSFATLQASRIRSQRVVFDARTDEAALSLASLGAAPDELEEPDELYEALFGRVCSSRIPPSVLLFSGKWREPRAMLALQAVYTNVLALAALLLAAPFMILIAILIKISSPGPVFRTTAVMGWRMTEFRLLHYRCHRLPREGQPPETTPLGRALLLLRLDRLPQLLNVLRGELAFVGPAPVPSEQAAALLAALPLFRLRFVVKPGMTGWSQLRSSPDDDDVARLERDLYYIKHLSPALDLSTVVEGLRHVRPSDNRKATASKA